MEELCKNCDSVLNYAEEEVAFEDEISGAAIVIALGACWCSSCGYSQVVRV